jgi:hypothetical protein
MNFKCEIVPISQVSLDPHNCKDHSPENINFIKESLKEFGFQKPIVVSKDMVIAAGNGTYTAAKELGFKEIPIAISDLSLEKIKAYAIADNQIGLTSSFNLDKLSEQLQQLAVWNSNQNWQALGFNDNSLKLMLSFDKEFKPTVEEDNFKEKSSNNTSQTDNKSTDKQKYKPIKVDDSQREIIQMAVQKLRDEENDQTIPEGKAVELICASYLS